MDPAEIKQIAQTVKEDRKRPLPAMSEALPLRFTRGRFITDADALDELELRQLVAVGVDGVGMALHPAQLLIEGEEEGFYQPEVWDVLDAQGALAYRVWIYGTDNGTVTRGQTPEIVAGMSQGGLEISRKKAPDCTDALLDALRAGARAVPEAERPEGSCLRFFARSS